MTGIRITDRGVSVHLTGASPDDVDELHDLFAGIVAAGEGYPQDPAEPVTREAFVAYWMAPATAVTVARIDGVLAGSWTMKPNGPGRAAHVANAGYIVDGRFRGLGVGELLVRHSLEAGPALGFDALQFNLVFESNPARRLYERLGFEVVGRVPDVIDGEAVLLYWRRLPAPGP
jgi:ribosomal protein S18 acetylase RimI-like enzyme